jgi:catalase
MNNSPVFVVSNPRDFYELTLAQDIDPSTGKSDPGAMKRFFATILTPRPLLNGAKTAPWTASWADQAYNSLDAFRLSTLVALATSCAGRWNRLSRMRLSLNGAGSSRA